jgi:hypothetical protein
MVTSASEGVERISSRPGAAAARARSGLAMPDAGRDGAGAGNAGSGGTVDDVCGTSTVVAATGGFA